MYIYLIIFMTVTIIALFSLRYKIRNKTINILLLALTLMLMLRYGQGSDYFSYQYLVKYYRSPLEAIANVYGLHGEIGFRILGSLFGENYKLFIAVVSLYEMYMFRRFLILHCKNKAFSVFLFFPTIFLTYYFSAIRQGIVIATFIGIGVSLAEKREWAKYYLMSAILITVHSAAFALLFLPVIEVIDLKSLLTIALPLSIVAGLFLATPFSNSILSRIPIIGYRLATATRRISLFATLERIVTLGIVAFYYLSLKKAERDARAPWWIKAYILGHVFYFVFLAFTGFATRLFICFKVLEIMFIPNLLKEHKHNRQIITVYFLLLSMIMYFHNINGYIAQGEYYSDVNAVNFPYISIFNQKMLLEVRDPGRYFELVD